MRWRIEQARPEHIPDIAANMREADRREVWAYRRHTPEQALRLSLSRSLAAWTGIVEERPALMWGVGAASLLSFTGNPWLLGTDAVHDIRRPFLLHSRAFVRLMRDMFPRLENFVHAENRLSIHWLKWLGFTLEEIPEVINGEDFYLFRKEDGHV
ncbi:MAG: hypothetical protein LBR94_01235 [Desulfovibrio sp.]|jgi:hypothetical protein|nr:hypothetical protein [Desulfovibrio sp.]